MKHFVSTGMSGSSAAALPSRPAVPASGRPTTSSGEGQP